MNKLSASQLLLVWEKGFSQSSIERAITILENAIPTATQQDLESLTIGDRNIHLLNTRENTFGGQMDCLTRCSHCCEPIEFTLDTRALKTETPTKEQKYHSFTLGQQKFKFQLIKCCDLAAAAQEVDLAHAEQILIERCIVKNNNDKHPIAVSSFSEATLKKLAKQLQRCDPNAELLINLTCPVCNEVWQTVFDIAVFLWDEINVHAKQLLTKIHQLAQAYGWNETDILALSNTRREYYLKQIN